jgi:hypothetical protein
MVGHQLPSSSLTPRSMLRRTIQGSPGSGNLFRVTEISSAFVSKGDERIYIFYAHECAGPIQNKYSNLACDFKMADTSLYDYPSPLEGLENLEPLSEYVNRCNSYFFNGY